MQASAFGLKGGLGFDIGPRRGLRGSAKLRSRVLASPKDRCMTERNSCFGLRLSSGSMGIELGHVRNSDKTVFGSSAKYRSIKAQASTG